VFSPTHDAKAGGRLLRWRLALAKFDFDVSHRSGVKNCNVDALSHFHLMRSEPYDEGPTDIYPATALNVIEVSAPVALADPPVSVPPGQGDVPAPLVRPAYFGFSDSTAWSAVDWIPLQSADAFCESIRTKLTDADVSVSNCLIHSRSYTAAFLPFGLTRCERLQLQGMQPATFCENDKWWT
jgi:hypothetical protein